MEKLNFAVLINAQLVLQLLIIANLVVEIEEMFLTVYVLLEHLSWNRVLLALLKDKVVLQPTLLMSLMNAVIILDAILVREIKKMFVLLVKMLKMLMVVLISM